MIKLMSSDGKTVIREIKTTHSYDIRHMSDEDLAEFLSNLDRNNYDKKWWLKFLQESE